MFFVIQLYPSYGIPFKLGFEFQEKNGLVPKAKEDDELQKKPIFEVKYDEEKLWHVEIDGDDIEFVTVPFAYNGQDKNELENLKKCMASIKLSIELLKKNTSECDFTSWENEITKVLHSIDTKYSVSYCSDINSLREIEELHNISKTQ